MSWTYTGNPSSSPKDTIRFLVGDTRSDDPLATDEEIAWALTQNSNIYAAAVSVAEGIYSYFATQADSEEIGPIKVQFTNRLKFYSEKIKQLMNKVSISSGMIPYAGGISIADIEAQNNDLDRVSPVFTVGMTDFDASVDQEIV